MSPTIEQPGRRPPARASPLVVANVACLVLLGAAFIGLGSCAGSPERLSPATALPAALDDVASVIILLAGAASIAQLVPGSERWRRMRRRAGLIGICVLWPALGAYSVAAYLTLDDALRRCLI